MNNPSSKTVSLADLDLQGYSLCERVHGIALMQDPVRADILRFIAADYERLLGEAEVADEQLAQLRGFADAHKTCRSSDETSDVENLRNAVAAMRSTRDEMQRRLIEQDGEIEKLRAELAEAKAAFNLMCKIHTPSPEEPRETSVAEPDIALDKDGPYCDEHLTDVRAWCVECMTCTAERKRSAVEPSYKSQLPPTSLRLPMPPVKPPREPDLTCDGFVPDPHSSFCDKCGYPEREHRRTVKASGELPLCDCDPDFGCKEYDPAIFRCCQQEMERRAAQENGEGL